MATLHKSPFAGSWYPGEAAPLESLLADRFAESEHRTGPFLPAGAVAYVVPHAGPAYSGTVAAAVYRSLAAQPPERVVLLAFPHRGGLTGVAAPDVDRIATPFGEIAVDGDFGDFPRVPESRVCDHSGEIQLPFLQRTLPGARLTILYVGHMDASARRAAADKLANAWQPGTVFIASSDFTHYGHSFGFQPFPADASVADRLRELDYACIDAAGSSDSALFLETLSQRDANVCGAGPIALLLDVLRERDLYQSVLDYQTSGEREGDYRHSVSYAALGYYPRAAFELTAPDREALLDAAAATLRRLRENGERTPQRAVGSPALGAHRGVFVSLHHGEELLGCVGNCSAREPLSQTIGDLTLASALDDPRFRPASTEKGPIDIEISLLTPFRRIRDTAAVQLGKHGAVLRLGAHSGLLLPHVAASRGWSSVDFWRALARKSLLAPFAWSDPNARLDVFEAQLFERRDAA
jgi:hypothetical protein